MSDIDSNMLERLHQQSQEIMRLRAEIERLKAALREYGVHARDCAVGPDHPCDCGWDEIARAALEGSDGALFPTKKICPECGQPMREGGYCDHIPF